MRARNNPTAGLLVLLAAVLLAGAALAQAPKKPGEIPRTPDGKPDLSGTYDVATLTPLVRPAKFGGKLFLSREEALAIEEEEREFLAKGSQLSDPNRPAPPDGGAPPVGLDESFAEFSGAGNVGGYNNFWIDRGSGAFEIDGEFRTSILVDPPNGQMPAMTPAGQKRLAELFGQFRPNDGTAYWLAQDGPGPYDHPEQRPHAERCLLGFGSTGGPPMLPVLYNNFKRIVQTPDTVVILVEMNHDVRVVRMNAEHEPSEIRRWMGDSVGRWEGDTLVVETRNFNDNPGLFFASRDLHVVERFTRLDADTLMYEFTVTDPSTWSAPWSGSYTWPATDERVYEYACHEGNYALGNIMRGARLLEAETLAKGPASDSRD
jgi:hypothetical protein